MANKKINSLKRTIKKYLSELILNEKEVVGGKRTATDTCRCYYSDGTSTSEWCETGRCIDCCGSNGGFVNPTTDPNDKVYKLKSANMMREVDILNESYYCNGAGQNASSHPGCREHGAACINWGEGVAGTMGQNVNDPDDWQCVPNELNVGTGGTGGGPLSGDDLVVKTKGGNKNPFYKPKPSIDQMMREAAKGIVKETEAKYTKKNPGTGKQWNKCKCPKGTENAGDTFYSTGSCGAPKSMCGAGLYQQKNKK